MISKKLFGANGSIKRFLSDFIIKSDQHVRVYNYVYDAVNGSDTVNIVDPITGLYLRATNVPNSDDVVSLEKFDLVHNSILFYITPSNGVSIYIEVATTPEEFGGTISQPAVERAETAAARAEAAAIAAEMTKEEMFERYMGSHSSNPLSGMITGSMYFNTTDEYIYIYSGTEWLSLNTMVETTILREQFTIADGTNVFTLTSDFVENQNQLTVVINGITQDTSTYIENANNTITLESDLTIDDEMEITIVQAISGDFDFISYIDAGDLANNVYTDNQIVIAKAYTDSEVVIAKDYTDSEIVTVNASIDAVNAKIASVKDYGATGDGVTDDTAAFKAALADMLINRKRVKEVFYNQRTKGILAPVIYLEQ